MKAEDYKRSEKPKAKRSVLFPYLKDILGFRKDGYSNIQIRAWLKTENIIISIESIRKFILNQEALPKSAIGSEPPESFDKSPSTPTTPTPTTPPAPAIKQPVVAPTKSSTQGTFKEKADRVSGAYFEDPNLAALGNFNKPKENT